MKSKRAVLALAALAQESRLSIFRLLVQAGPDGLPAGEIGTRLGIAPATLSFHLKELINAGLAANRQEGRFVIYTARFDTMGALLSFLTEDCCAGRPELCAPAAPGVALPHPKRRNAA